MSLAQFLKAMAVLRFGGNQDAHGDFETSQPLATVCLRTSAKPPLGSGPFKRTRAQTIFPMIAFFSG